MIKADKVAELLQKQLELMETLKGRDLGGFALICPPGGATAVEITLIASHTNPSDFFKQVAEKCGATAKEWGDQNQFSGAVRGVR